MAPAQEDAVEAAVSDRPDAVKVALIYAVLASLWMWVSDRLVLGMADDPEAYRSLEIYKDWLFVLITTGVLMWMLFQFVDILDDWQDALEDTRQSLRDSFDSMGTAVAIVNRDGYYTYANPTYCELFGYSSEELLGASATMTGLEGTLPERSPAGTIAYATEHREGWRGEALRVDSSGRIIPVYLTVSPLYHGGELYGFLGDLIDLRTVKKWPPKIGGFARSLYRLLCEPNLESFGQAAVAEAVADTGAEVGVAYLFDQTRQRLNCHWQAGGGEELPPEVEPDEGLWGEVLREERALWINEAVEADVDFVLLPGVEIESVAAVPVDLDGELLGVLMVATLERSHAFDDNEISMLEAIGDALAAAIDREPTARIYHPSLVEPEELDAASTSGGDSKAP